MHVWTSNREPLVFYKSAATSEVSPQIHIASTRLTHITTEVPLFKKKKRENKKQNQKAKEQNKPKKRGKTEQTIRVGKLRNQQVNWGLKYNICM